MSLTAGTKADHPYLKKYYWRKSPSNQTCPAKLDSFKEEYVDSLFELLSKSNNLKLPAVRFLQEVRKTDDSNCYFFHRMIGHPIRSCFTFIDVLQAIINAGVLKFCLEQKIVTANMTSFKGKARSSSRNVMWAFIKEVDSDVPPIWDSEHETVIMATQVEAPLVTKTRSGN